MTAINKDILHELLAKHQEIQSILTLQTDYMSEPGAGMLYATQMQIATIVNLLRLPEENNE